MYKAKLILCFFSFPLMLFSQKKPPPPPAVDLILKSHWIKFEIDKQGKEIYSNKSNGIVLNGKKTINETFLNTKTDIVNSYINTKYRKKGNFNKGYKTGLWKTTYKNETLKWVNWQDGLIRDGYLVKDINGNTLYETNFGQYGNGMFKDYYHKTGSLKQEGRYKNGKKDGEWCEYNKQGRLIAKKNYQNGLKTGRWNIKCKNLCNYTHYILSFDTENYGEVLFYKGEKLWQKGERYINQIRQGIWYIYDYDQNPIRKHEYINGKTIAKYHWKNDKWIISENNGK